MIILKYLLFIVIFVVGELLINRYWFKYLKRKFTHEEANEESDDKEVQPAPTKLFGLHISTFKGVMERFIMATCLAIGFYSILIVFGALKIGTRLKSVDDQIQNDYFLVGNLSSIFVSVIYIYMFEKFLFLW